jgi:hypothetical protein
MSSNLTITDSKRIEQEANRIVGEITDAWKKTTQTWLGISKALVQYRDNKSEDGKQVWKLVQIKLDDWGIRESTIKKLCVIGDRQILHKYVDYLPPSYNKIYEITSLTDSEIESHIKRKQIHPEMQGEAVKLLTGKSDSSLPSKTTSSKKLDSSNRKTIIEIQMTDSYLAKNLDEIHKQFGKVKIMFKSSKSVAVDAKGLFKRKLDQGDVDE